MGLEDEIRRGEDGLEDRVVTFRFQVQDVVQAVPAEAGGEHAAGDLAAAGADRKQPSFSAVGLEDEIRPERESLFSAHTALRLQVRVKQVLEALHRFRQFSLRTTRVGVPRVVGVKVGRSFAVIGVQPDNGLQSVHGIAPVKGLNRQVSRRSGLLPLYPVSETLM